MSGIIAQNSGRHTGLVKAASGGGDAVWNLIETLTSDVPSTKLIVESEDAVISLIFVQTPPPLAALIKPEGLPTFCAIIPVMLLIHKGRCRQRLYCLNSLKIVLHLQLMLCFHTHL